MCLTSLGIAGVLYAFRSVLIPFLLAVFPALSLIPAIDVQMKWLRIPRRTAILATVPKIPGTVQFVIGNLLQPTMIWESLDLCPVVVLMSLFFRTIWGIIGMLVSVPITAVVMILLQRCGYTRAIADLAAGKADVPTKTNRFGKT